MKRKNICAEAALREVARKNHTTVEEVRERDSAGDDSGDV